MLLNKGKKRLEIGDPPISLLCSHYKETPTNDCQLAGVITYVVLVLEERVSINQSYQLYFNIIIISYANDSLTVLIAANE